MEIRIRLCVQYTKGLTNTLGDIFKMISEYSIDMDDGYFSYFEDFDICDIEKMKKTINHINIIIEYFSHIVSGPSFKVSVSIFSDKVKTELILPLNHILSISKKVTEIEFYVFSWGCQKSKGIRLIEKNIDIRIIFCSILHHCDVKKYDLIRKTLNKEKIKYNCFNKKLLIEYTQDNTYMFDFSSIEINNEAISDDSQIGSYLKIISPWAECSFAMPTKALEPMLKYNHNLHIIFNTFGCVKR